MALATATSIMLLTGCGSKSEPHSNTEFVSESEIEKDTETETETEEPTQAPTQVFYVISSICCKIYHQIMLQIIEIGYNIMA